ncbi:GGDEF domain-containing protein [Microbacterium awajiense]|uniref:GGDEF domain-containing protein n=1 Tax=Microbacterium awajiense TaxID=415214 RepID=UPI0031D8C255
MEPEAQPFGVIRTSETDMIVDANPWFAAWSARTLDALRGRALSSILIHVEDDLFQGDQWPGPLIMRHVSAPERAVMVSRHPQPGGDLLVVTEATERYRALRALRASYALADRTASRLALIIEASIALSTATGETELAGILAQTAENAYRAEHAVVVLTGDDRGAEQVAGRSPLDDSTASALVGLVDGAQAVVTVSAPDEADALVPGLGDSMRRAGVHAILAAPIRLGEEVLGAIITFFSHERVFDQEAAPLAEALAGQGAQALATMRLQARLAHAAMHDEVTGLPNRRALERAVPATTTGTIAVIFVDVDGFKAVNDRYGHHCGDAVLREVGQRLRAIVREHDLVSRYGGDEFVVIADVPSRDEAHDMARRICERLRDVYEDLVDAALGASVGVVVASQDDALTLDRLVRAADQAMYRAKSAGGNGVAVGIVG